MSILRRPGRLAIVFLLLGCAVLVAAVVTVRTASGGSDPEPLGPAVSVTPTARTPAADTSTPPTGSPSATSDDDDDDDDATPVSPRTPSAAGDDDQDDDKDDDKDDRRGD